MSWLFSRALVEEYSAANCSDGELSAQLNGSLIPQAFCAPDKTTAFSRLSRFGMTFKPLTADRGEELLMWYLAGFHAKTSAQPEKVRELKENDQECGSTWRGSFARYDHDTHSLRTHQCSLFEDLTESCVTLPQWGLMRRGECWERQTLAQTTKGRGFGSLAEMIPTPTTQANVQIAGEGKAAKNPRRGTTLAGWVVKKHREMYLTPQANEDAAGRPGSKMQKMLGNSPEVRGTTPEQWATGTLNPTWTEWLMGWPLGWTDLKPLVTVKSHSALQQHGKYSQEN